MPRKLARRQKRAARRLGFSSLFLIGLGAGSGFAAIAAYTKYIPLPGRPVLQVPFSSIDGFVKLVIFVLGVLSSIVLFLQRDRYIGIVAGVLYALVALGQWWAPAAATLLILLSLAEYSLEITIIATLLSSLLLVMRPLNSFVASIGAAIGFGEILVALVAGVFASVTMLFGRARKFKLITTGNDRIGLLMLLISLVLSIVMVFIPHMRYGFNKIISYDTYYNIRFCELYRQGDYVRAFFSWQRPLYAAIVTVSGAILDCKPWFFDVVVQSLGFSALALSLWILMKRATRSKLLAGASSLIGVSYWAPFFLYAGLQTNLLALPVALYLAYISIEEPHRKVMLVLLSLFLGLWHPWTLAFYSIAIALSMLHKKNSLSDKLGSLLYSLIPGWLAYSIVVLVAGRSGVAAVARGGVSRAMPLLWNLKIYFWGVVIRPDVILPLSITIVVMYLIIRDKPLPPWLIGPTALGLLGILIPNSKLLVRFLVDAPLPLMLVVLASTRKEYLRLLLLISISTLLTLGYFVETISPVVKFPH